MAGSLDWTWYTLAALLAAGGFALAVWALFHDRARNRRRCPKCWYSMEGIPSTTCPECGKNARTERRLLRTRRRWGRFAIALTLSAAGYVSSRVPAWRDGGWSELVPTTALVLAAPAHADSSHVLFGSTTLLNDCQKALWKRMRDGNFWRWQSSLYVARCIASESITPSDWFRTPQVWLRGEPVPIRIGGFQPWGVILATGAADGSWRTSEQSVPPPAGDTVAVPFRMFVKDRLMYEGLAHCLIHLCDTEDEFMKPAPPEMDQLVAHLVRPELVKAADGWYVRAAGERPPDYPRPERTIIAFRIVLRRGTELLASTEPQSFDTTLVRWSSSRLNLDPPDPAATLAGDAQLTLCVEGDIKAAIRHWLGPTTRFDLPPPRWNGRFEVPIMPDTRPQ